MFTTSAFILQLAYACLMATAVTSHRNRPRVLIACAAGLLALRAAMPPLDLVTIAWMAVILLVCGYLVGRTLVSDAGVRFTPEEAAMRAAIFDTLPASAARQLIDQGWWLTGKEGDVLTRQGEPIDTLLYLAEGGARVMVDGKQVGSCMAGDLIGEATALTGAPATATAILSSPARFWCIKAATLRDHVAANPDIGARLERSFRNALRAKLMASNRAIADRPGTA